MPVEDVLLEEFLLDSGLLTRTQVAQARTRASERGQELSRALVESGLLTEDDARRAQAHALGVPYIQLERGSIDPSALFLIPEPLCRAHGMVAFAAHEHGVEVAMLDLSALKHATFLRGRVLPRLVPRSSLTQALLLYQKLLKEKFEIRLSGAVEGREALEALLAHAHTQGAASVRIEHTAAGTRVRYRISGLLHDAMVFSTAAGERLIARIAELAGFSAHHTLFRLPREARMQVDVPLGGHTEPLVVYVSSVPAVEGSTTVLQLAAVREGRNGFSFESLGFHGESLERMHRIVRSRTGNVALAGPQGSGLSTTFYTMLDALNRPHNVLYTVERDIELPVAGITQIHVNEASGLSPYEAARAALRQDPDVLALHDIDDERVRALASAAAERCLVISTVRTLVEQGLTAAVQQRLVRRLCTKCAEEHTLSRAEMQMLEPVAELPRVLTALKEEGVIDKQAQWKDVPFYRAEGCDKCEDGYAGHIGVQEVLVAGEEAALNIVEDALFKAAQGLTSIEEIVRVFREETPST